MMHSHITHTQTSILLCKRHGELTGVHVNTPRFEGSKEGWVSLVSSNGTVLFVRQE